MVAERVDPWGILTSSYTLGSMILFPALPSRQQDR